MSCRKCNSTEGLVQFSGGYFECINKHKCHRNKCPGDYYFMRNGDCISPYDFVYEEELLSEDDKILIKNLYDTDNKHLHQIIRDAYDTYYDDVMEEVIRDRKEEIIEYCISNGYLVSNPQVEPKERDFSDDWTIKKVYRLCKYSKYCKGHVGIYESECSTLCSSCDEWTCSCSSFCHCCCFLFKGKSVI